MSELVTKARVLELTSPDERGKKLYVPIADVYPHKAFQDEDGLVQIMLVQGALSAALAPEFVATSMHNLTAQLAREADLSQVGGAETFDETYDLSQTRVYRLAESTSFDQNFDPEVVNRELYLFFSALTQLF